MTDYAAIANDRARLERTASNSIRTISELYADRAHFIYELLQNAEDALRKRPRGWNGSRIVKFALSDNRLQIGHYGKPFDRDDVVGVCGVGEKTKTFTDIGRFGIGFKSVYAFTKRPEIHSGAEDFVIEEFVKPVRAEPLSRDGDETVILIPRTGADHMFRGDIANGLTGLAPGTLQFLRQIEAVEWVVDGKPVGSIRREKPEGLDEGVRRVTVVREALGQDTICETSLVFSKPVTTDDGKEVGFAELAFLLSQERESQPLRVSPVSSSPLVVFFPTIRETNLGFRVQGPYRTTPSRDNVPPDDEWNKYLVSETAGLMVAALEWLRGHELLGVAALQCLPLDADRFREGTMYRPLFDAAKEALRARALLPRHGGGYASADSAILAGSAQLRNLLSPSQLSALVGKEGDTVWLSSDITQSRAHDLTEFLKTQLGVDELTSEKFIRVVDGKFLEGQPDSWIRTLYEYLGELPYLSRAVSNLPLVRLADGQQVTAVVDGNPQAFLPGSACTEFPTVCSAVCASKKALEFLRSLGLAEPDLVDDVVLHVLPRYKSGAAPSDESAYEADLVRIQEAYDTDSKAKQITLQNALRETRFLRARDAGSGLTRMCKPGCVYLSTGRLRSLFVGIEGVMFVDDTFKALKGERVRRLLEACGVRRYLRPVGTRRGGGLKMNELRARAGTTGTRSREFVDDYTLDHLDALLDSFPSLPRAAERAEILWDALADLEQRERSVFT
ncbi:MAG: hypothetical protein JXA57_08125, partial [Armatimonadetes bacterium]|nr:hypothetical protein [Armatimonadota bacterium]